ncbi:SURF1 family protein [Extensimonas sp. H3M7-6]|uniref:SURF1 family protein n=1 Tax=Extensimonas soli TaxID=3031322 RepID=UPI0023DC78B8|nr:SURF1 family protein [Extensimonas sp. H3M7-6]MDF1481226.1 SURF1 family protein [Extensimonas sp. H3M7-6]
MREIVTPSQGQRLGGRFWLITLAAVCGVVLTLALGRWQLGRAAQKEALQASMAERAALPALDGNQLFFRLPQDAQRAREEVEPLLYRSVVLTGRWLPAHTVYLDNRQMQGRPGFFVCTPLQLEPGGAVVFVQRGWVPRNFEARTQLPQVQSPPGLVQVQGRLAPPPSRLFDFGRSAAAPGSSPIRQNLDLAAYRAETGLPLADWTVLQTGPASEGLLRDWPPVALGIEKHYGYALQWFGLSGLIALLYVWFQIVRRFLRPRTQPAA